jgi:RNA polymerase sigma-70 factor (ECF subfamily)
MMNESIQHEPEIVRMLNEGNESALKYVYDHYSNRIYFLAMKFLKSPELSQELVQDVFLKLWEKRAELDCDRPVEAWLYTVAKNRIINQFKKQAREHNRVYSGQLTTEILDGKAGADHKILASEMSRVLKDAINQLPEKQREVYTLAKLEGYSRGEIADQMQISALTVKTHMSRAAVSVKNFMQSRGITASH